MTTPEGSAGGTWPWFALWTRSRHDQIVREQLQQKQIDVFLPTLTNRLASVSGLLFRPVRSTQSATHPQVHRRRQHRVRRRRAIAHPGPSDRRNQAFDRK